MAGGTMCVDEMKNVPPTQLFLGGWGLGTW